MLQLGCCLSWLIWVDFDELSSLGSWPAPCLVVSVLNEHVAILTPPWYTSTKLVPVK
jgi:hypothetical protein